MNTNITLDGGLSAVRASGRLHALFLSAMEDAWDCDPELGRPTDANALKWAPSWVVVTLGEAYASPEYLWA